MKAYIKTERNAENTAFVFTQFNDVNQKNISEYSREKPRKAVHERVSHIEKRREKTKPSGRNGTTGLPEDATILDL